jgi:hypothetical protein
MLLFMESGIAIHQLFQLNNLSQEGQGNDLSLYGGSVCISVLIVERRGPRHC